MDEAWRSLERQALSGDHDALQKLKIVWLRTQTKSMGVLYATTDEQINEAIEQGRKITTKLIKGDVILVNSTIKPWPVDGPYLGVVTELAPTQDGKTANCTCIPIDYLDSPPSKNDKGELAVFSKITGVLLYVDEGDTITVLKRYGKDL